MAKKKEQSVSDKLKNLYKLQLIDSELDQIKILKGELPIEVADLEDELAGLQKRIDKLDSQLEDLGEEKAKHERNIKEAGMLNERYKQQLDEVKNNREYEALQKEIELQDLEVQLSEKRIAETEERIAGKQEIKDATEEKKATREDALQKKRVELEEIQKKTEKEEKSLQKESEEARKEVDARLLKSYNRIRNSYRNGLAVVTIERDACAGCFNKIPPQIQNEVRSRKHIVPCEHCGRIIVDEEMLVQAGVIKEEKV